MARKKKKVIEEENIESADQLEVQAEEVPEVEVPVEQPVEEEAKEEEVVEEVVEEVLEEGYVTVNRFHKSAYAGLKGKIVQDLVSSYKLETDLGLVIMPKDQVS